MFHNTCQHSYNVVAYVPASKPTHEVNGRGFITVNFSLVNRKTSYITNISVLQSKIPQCTLVFELWLQYRSKIFPESGMARTLSHMQGMVLCKI